MSKINKLLQLQPAGVVLTSGWLSQHGYSPELLRNYRKSHWLEAIGNGAMIRQNDPVDYLGGVYALQQQLNLAVHPGAKTALSMLGKTHYLDLGANVVYLFGKEKERLPVWFKNHNWGVEIKLITSSFLPSEAGLIEKEHKSFSVKIASAARAMMECLYLAPQNQNILECFEVMQGLTSLQPKTIQDLLENCSSVKVKRLFLYLAEKAGHAWFNHLNINQINLGHGNRSLASNGAYVSKYKLTVPKELERNDYPEL
ncbi:MAG: type IV toxin-antitoxin system AbiEi family antitoxin [Bacteroidales bacterium]|nr:type IV toxin-antitoxin system AbiEi family antitoxin [Bacteroidales bacterium]